MLSSFHFFDRLKKYTENLESNHLKKKQTHLHLKAAKIKMTAANHQA